MQQADERLALRLNALRLAKRRGSIRDGAWAAARIRLPDVSLGPAEARFARDVQVRYGRALRVALQRRPGSPAAAHLAAPVAISGWRRRALVGGLAAVCIALVLLVVSDPDLNSQTAAGGGTPVVVGLVAPTLPPLRGRSQNLPAVVEVAAASPTPEATDAPPTPAPTVAPAGTPVIRVSGAGGSGGGTGGGSGGGSATASPTATPRPSPTPTPAPDPATTMILRGRVVDSRSGAGVPQVCVAPGLNTCAGQTVTYTDAGGYWELVLSIGQNWDIKFLKTGYFANEIKVPSQPGIHYVPDIRLRRSS